jgi:hypothetical protein
MMLKKAAMRLFHLLACGKILSISSVNFPIDLILSLKIWTPKIIHPNAQRQSDTDRRHDDLRVDKRHVVPASDSQPTLVPAMF